MGKLKVHSTDAALADRDLAVHNRLEASAGRFAAGAVEAMCRLFGEKLALDSKGLPMTSTKTRTVWPARFRREKNVGEDFSPVIAMVQFVGSNFEDFAVGDAEVALNLARADALERLRALRHAVARDMPLWHGRAIDGYELYARLFLVDPPVGAAANWKAGVIFHPQQFSIRT